MAEVDGKVVMRSGEGHLYQVDPADVPTVARDHGWQVAPDDAVQKRIEERAQYSQYGSTGQQALGAAETAVRTATLGAVPGFGSPADVQGRSEVLQKESPVTNFLAQAAGAAVPAIATGGALGAAGLGAEGAGLLARGAVTAAEGFAGGHANEVEQARQDQRPYQIGNVLMYDVGGSLIGHAVPAMIRAGAGRVAGALERRAATEAGEGVLAGAERRALEASADVADGVPLGPDRDTFLANAHKQVIDQASERGAKSLDQISSDMSELSGEGTKRAQVRKLIAKTNPEQRDWAAAQSQSALDFRQEIQPRPYRERVPEGAVPEGALPEGAAPGEAPSPSALRDYSQIHELKQPVKDVNRVMTEGSAALDKASEAHEWFEASGQLERGLAQQEDRLYKLAHAEGAAPEAQELLDKVSAYRSQLRLDRERSDLWGDAGGFQKSINRAMDDQWRPGARDITDSFARDTAEGPRFDPSQLRKHLSADEIGRGLAPEQLGKMLDGAEQTVATHRQYGTASEQQLSRMDAAIKSVREQVALSDDVRGAKSRVAEREGVARESAKFDKEQAGALREQKLSEDAKARADDAKGEMMSHMLGAAAGFAGHSLGLGAVVTVGSKLLRMTRLLDTLGRTGEATVASAAKGAVMGNAGRVLRAVESGAMSGAKATVPLVQTAMARFQGDYPTLQTAFEAKRKTLDAVMQNPLVLHRAIAQHLGPMSKVAPEAYGQISARLQAAAQYLHENMPSQLSASMVHPNGIPLSRATARDFALKYNASMNPASVLQDVRDGRASPTQIKALETVHPDIYQSLKLQLARAVAENPGAMTTQRKVQLDILFGGDGMAGRAFGWTIAKAIKDMRAERATGAAANSAPPAIGKTTPARGTSAIKSSVTNAA